MSFFLQGDKEGGDAGVFGQKRTLDLVSGVTWNEPSHLQKSLSIKEYLLCVRH